MMSNSNQNMETLQASFPHLYNIYDKNTILYAILSVFGERYGVRTNIIDRLYAMIGIDSTYDEDLEHRWGSLLGVYRQENESYADYRSRLLIIYSSLAGGTAEAIKYAIASVIGITSNEDAINEYIKIYDAWKYPYDVDPNIITDTSYGNIICTIDLQANESIVISTNKIIDAINATKASGVYPYLLFIYNATENITLSYEEDDIISNLSIDTSDNASIMIDTDDYDRIIVPSINESGRIGKSLVWSFNGTNSTTVLNSDFVTNMLMEVDECKDIIIHGVTVLGEAILGASAIGVMPI